MEKLSDNEVKIFAEVDSEDIKIINVVVRTTQGSQVLSRDMKPMAFYHVSFSYEPLDHGILKNITVQTEWSVREESYGYYSADWSVWHRDLREVIARSLAWDLDYSKSEGFRDGK